MFNNLLKTMLPDSWMTPEMGSFMATDPEKAAEHLAARGVPPPPAGGQLQNPYVAPNETYTGQVPYDPNVPVQPRTPNISEQIIANLKNSWNRANASESGSSAGEQPGSYSALAAPNLASFMSPAQAAQVAPQAPTMAPPTAPQMGAPTGNDPLSAAAPQATGTNPVGGLAKALSGLKAPANPETQKITSPRLPQQSAIPSGSPIAALLAKAVAGDPTAMLTLRAAIGGGR